MSQSSITHQNVHPSQLTPDPLKHGQHLLLLGDVTLDSHHFTSAGSSQL